ncbi:hypothetical protein [Phreatobacter stygius]|uniref:Uncharacterized protein n=1 Tax=Phreatobacter stygius TaxID=1940610 RepID=A0A4D7B5J5_9HYPH|nr:hypothetical protein [Phreatobacter stygius]QCI63277.1 hypothetical protein E8M01_02935 [Phreatobacter stygius]
MSPSSHEHPGQPPTTGGRRTLPLWAHLTPLAVGLAIFAIGFIWFDPLWPAQDMPPDVALRYRRAVQRSGEIYAVARWTALAGLIWFAGMALWRLRPTGKATR